MALARFLAAQLRVREDELGLTVYWPKVDLDA
jgi:hypothetical protein